MAKKQDISWVKNLPNGGQAWGQGIVATVEALDAEIADIEAQQQALLEKLRDRRKLRNATAKRADREAPSLFEVADINAAKAEAVSVDVDVDAEPATLNSYSAAQ